MKSFIKKSNSGFSLVELMIGVAILAIILIPITSAIISSGNFVSDSYELSDATMLAESLAEQFEVMEISELLDAPSNSTIPSIHTEAAEISGLFVEPSGNTYVAPATDPTAPPYYIEYKGLSSGYSTYNAVVKIDPSNDNHFDTINSQNIFQNFDVGFVASKIDGSTNDFDEISWNEFKLEAATKGYNLDPSVFPARSSIAQDRNIILDITQKDNGGTETIHMSLTYSYEYTYPAGTSFAGDKYTWEKTVNLTSFEGIVKPSSSADYPTVFISFFPWYQNGSDNITINNLNDFPVTVALSKQADPNLTVAELGTAEINHNGFNVDISESEYITKNLKIMSNLSRDLSNTAVAISVNFSNGFTPETSAGSLLSSESIDRIFRIDIELFETNADGDSMYISGAVYDVDLIKLR